MLFDEPNILKYFNAETKKYEEHEESFWKDLLLKKFRWMRELIERNTLEARLGREPTPEDLANLCDQ
jgi:hypothetical protein